MLPEWLPSLTNPTICNSFNLAFNLGFSHMQKTIWDGWASNCCSGNMLYGFNSGTSYPDWINPFYIGTMVSTGNISGGSNYGNNSIFGNYQFNGGMNNFNNWMNPWGNNPGTTQNKDDSLSTVDQIKYNNLKDLLNNFADKELKNSTEAGKKALYIDIKAIIDNKDDNNATKYKKLSDIYEKIDKDDIKSYLYKQNKTTLQEIGDAKFSSKYSEVSITINEGLESIGKDQSDTDQFLNYQSDDVIGIISAYNTLYDKNIAKAMKQAYDKADIKNTAIKGIRTFTNSLVAKAEEVKESNLLDNKTKTEIKNYIKALNSAFKGDNLDDNFESVFNNLYIIVRAAMAKIAEKPLQDMYYAIDPTLITIYEDAIEDMAGENLGKDKNELTNSVKNINTKKAFEYTNNNSAKQNEDLNNATNKEKIKTLVDDGILTEVQDATVNDAKVYQDNSKNHYILRDDKFVEVTQDSEENEWKVLEGGKTLTANEMKTAGDKVKRINQELEKINDDRDFVKVSNDPQKFKGAAENPSITAEKDYDVYQISTVNGTIKYYIMNDDGKLLEVELKDNRFIIKSGIGEKTYENVKAEIDDEKQKALNKTNLLQNLSYTTNENRKINGVAQIMKDDIKQGEWCYSKESFLQGFDDTIGRALAYNPKNKFCNAYKKEDWNNAYKELKDYVDNLYSALNYIDWNKNNDINRHEEKKNFTENGIYACKSKGDQFLNYHLGEFAKSDQILYVGCNYDSWSCNGFNICVNTAKVWEKFKSFLPKN